MGLFRRAARSRFPREMLRWLEDFGRFSLDVHLSGIDAAEVSSGLPALYEYAIGDRQRFLAELQALVTADQGGYATYGAARLVWEMYGSECLHIPAALPLIDAGIEFKRSRGLIPGMFTGYERERLAQIDAQGG